MENKFAGIVGLVAIVLALNSHTLIGFAAAASPVTVEDYGEEGRAVARILSEEHYSRRAPDDALSRQWLQSCFDLVDPGRRWLLREDIAGLEKRFGDALDDAVLAGDVSPAKVLYSRLRDRVRERGEWVEAQLKRKDPELFDFSGDDTGPRETALEAWPENRAGADASWTRLLRAEVLAEKLRSDTDTADARARVAQRYRRLVKQVLKAEAEEIFDHYMTAFARCYDGHCEYFSESELSRFNSSIGGRRFGIGSLLRMNDAGICTVAEVLRGGPAERAGLHVGDRLVAITEHGAQVPIKENVEFDDLIHLKLRDIVEYIQGNRESHLTMKVVPAMSPDPGVVREILLTRGPVSLDGKLARAAMLEVGEQNVGWVDPHSFYEAYMGEDGLAVFRDLAGLITQLEKEDAAGLVLDLRRNRGGSLKQGLNVASLFLGDRPVVRIRKSVGEDGEIHRGNRKKAHYSGPLVVLVDSFTASTAEVVAGALQDHGRAIVVGNSPTMGKGKVQMFSSLKRELEDLKSEAARRAGALKFTMANYYRPSGKAIQGKGVVPDVLVPWGQHSSPDAPDLPNPLPHDEVEPVPNFNPIAKLKSEVQLVDRNPERTALEKKLAAMRDAPEISLNEEQRRAEVAEIGKILARLDEPSEARPPARIRKLYSVNGGGGVVELDVEAGAHEWFGPDGEAAIRVLLDLAARSR